MPGVIRGIYLTHNKIFGIIFLCVCNYPVRKGNDDEKHYICVVTFDKIKGGMEVSVNAAEYLDARCYVHIISFGKAMGMEHIQ